MRRFAVLLLALILLGCAGQKVEKVNPKEILAKAERAVNSTNLEANATFELKLKSPKFTDYTQYDLRVVKLNNTTKIFFLDYLYNTTDSSLAEIHKKMEIALKDAWILDKGDAFYVYTPNLMYMKNKVGKYKPAESLPRYKFIPIVTCLDVAKFFNKAENVSLIGENGKCYVIAYSLQYPNIAFAKVANVKVWISKADYIPIKAEITANFSDTAITMITELKSYRTNGVKCNMSLNGLRVVERYW